MFYEGGNASNMFFRRQRHTTKDIQLYCNLHNGGNGLVITDNVAEQEHV